MELEATFIKSAELHDLATDLEDEAYFARRAGDKKAELKYTRQAFEKEAEAAELLRQDPTHYMHAVLHLGAAHFAYRSGYYREAENLIAHGLIGDLGDTQRSEFYELLAKVRLNHSLESAPPTASDNELELTLQGPEADAGLLDVNTLLSQVKDWATLLRSTIRYVLSYEYTDKRSSDKSFRVLAAPPAKGSFKINMRLMPIGKQLVLPTFDTSAINARILNNFSTLQSGNLSLLRSSYNDADYFHEFMKHAESVAPDGETVTALGIEAAVENRRQRVLFDRTADEIRSVYVPPDTNNEQKEYQLSTDTETVTGKLLFANAMAKDEELRLITDEEKEWRIHLTSESEENLPRRYYKSRVKVTGRHKYKDRKSNLLVLDSIEPAKD